MLARVSVCRRVHCMPVCCMRVRVECHVRPQVRLHLPQGEGGVWQTEGRLTLTFPPTRSGGSSSTSMATLMVAKGRLAICCISLSSCYGDNMRGQRSAAGTHTHTHTHVVRFHFVSLGSPTQTVFTAGVWCPGKTRTGVLGSRQTPAVQWGGFEPATTTNLRDRRMGKGTWVSKGEGRS